MSERGELILERRLRIGDDSERQWWLVRYFREYPFNIGFEACRTWFQRDDRPIGGVVTPLPTWTFLDPHHFPSRQPAPFLRGGVKFDGCVNYEFLPEDPPCMLHACSREELVSLGVLLGRIYDQCAELLRVVDADACCHPDEAEPVRIDADPCETCAGNGEVISFFGILSSTSSPDEDWEHQHGAVRTTYACRSGHRWQVTREEPCPAPMCPYGRGLDEAIDRARSRDRRSRGPT